MAMITLIVGFVLGLALLRMVGGTTLQGGNRVEASRAAYMADAGINYGYWKYRYCGISVPSTETRQMGRDSFTVTIASNPDMRDTVKITSTGMCKGMQYRRQRIIRSRIRPSEYALMVNSSVTSWYYTETGSGGQNGDVYINGYLNLNAGMVVNGKLSTTGIIYDSWRLSASAPQTTGSGNPQLPLISLSYYASKANRVYSGDIYFYSGLQFNAPYEIIYVTGRLTLQGTVSGKGLIVVNGNVELPHEVVYANSATDKMAMLVTGSLWTKAANNMVDGLYYVHNGSNTAYYKADADMTFRRGGLAADTFSSTRKLKFVADPDYKTSDLGYRMHLPGYETADIADTNNQVVVTD